jgi:hypothetical protein
MKLKFAFILGFISLMTAAAAHAGNGLAVEEKALVHFGTNVSVTAATHTWTQADSTTTALGGGVDRAGFFFTNWSTNNASFLWLCHASAPTENIAVGQEILKGEHGFIPCGSNLHLYLRSMHTSPESYIIGEAGQ